MIVHHTNFLKGERHFALYLFMENNQNTPNRPQRPKASRIDLIIMALGILVIWRVDWGNMNSFHYLIMFMFFLCLMLRWGNIRKAEAKKQKQKDYAAQKAAQKAAYEAAVALAESRKAAKEAAAEATETPAAETPSSPAEEKSSE